jgi:hypothetical protein
VQSSGEVADRTYRLVVAGELGDSLAIAFDGMTLTRADGTTALTGRMRDQSELQGLLRRISDFGLTLLEVNAIDDRSPDAGGEMNADSRTEM